VGISKIEGWHRNRTFEQRLSRTVKIKQKTIFVAAALALVATIALEAFYFGH
jgi:hypothetical protein